MIKVRRIVVQKLITNSPAMLLLVTNLSSGKLQKQVTTIETIHRQREREATSEAKRYLGVKETKAFRKCRDV